MLPRFRVLHLSGLHRASDIGVRTRRRDVLALLRSDLLSRKGGESLALVGGEYGGLDVVEASDVESAVSENAGPVGEPACLLVVRSRSRPPSEASGGSTPRRGPPTFGPSAGRGARPVVHTAFRFWCERGNEFRRTSLPRFVREAAALPRRAPALDVGSHQSSAGAVVLLETVPLLDGRVDGYRRDAALEIDVLDAKPERLTDSSAGREDHVDDIVESRLGFGPLRSGRSR